MFAIKEVTMTTSMHCPLQQNDLKVPNFTLWRLQKEYDSRHQSDVNRQLNARSRLR
jgi:hypothetical protein